MPINKKGGNGKEYLPHPFQIFYKLSKIGFPIQNSWNDPYKPNDWSQQRSFKNMVLVIAKFMVMATCDETIWLNQIFITKTKWLNQIFITKTNCSITHPKYVGRGDGGVCLPSHCINTIRFDL